MSNNLSNLTSCGHCHNISQMKLIGSTHDFIVDEEQEHGYFHEYGTTYEILKCPACKKNNIVSYFWSSNMEQEDEEQITYSLLHPKENNFPIGLPDKILKTLNAAEKIKNIDVNAYTILLRRLLEQVCLDRNAEGELLAVMLNDLANKGEIPEKLVKVAKGLKDFGNMGAHAGIGELSEEEIPIVKALTYAVLEYIYSAPHLANMAETKLNSIKKRKQ